MTQDDTFKRKLSWIRRGPNWWELQAEDGELWAVISKRESNRPNPPLLADIKRVGAQHWQYARTVASARYYIERWLHRCEWTLPPFELASCS